MLSGTVCGSWWGPGEGAGTLAGGAAEESDDELDEELARERPDPARRNNSEERSANKEALKSAATDGSKS